VDRYKQLLLKQRDIMIALTQRLVERDEQIMALQDELDAYDRHHKELEEKLDEKTALLIKFQRISLEVNASSPFKSEELSTALEAMNRLDRGESASDEKPVEHASGAELVDPSSGVMRSLGSSTDSLQVRLLLVSVWVELA
jgi:kinesin family protein 3/17